MRATDIFTRSMWIGLGIAAGIFIAIRYVFNPIMDIQVRTIIFLAGLPIGALVGGYYVGRGLGTLTYLQGFVIAVLDVVIFLILGLIPLNPILLGVSLVSGLLGVLLAQRMPFSSQGTIFSKGKSSYPDRRNFYSHPPPLRRTVRINNPFGNIFSSWRANRLYEQLLRRVRMDSMTATRLIEFERRRTPAASREILIRNAIERLNRDRR